MITNLCTTPEGVRVEKTPDHHLSYEDGLHWLGYLNVLSRKGASRQDLRVHVVRLCVYLVCVPLY